MHIVLILLAIRLREVLWSSGLQRCLVLLYRADVRLPLGRSCAPDSAKLGFYLAQVARAVAADLGQTWAIASLSYRLACALLLRLLGAGVG